MGLVILILGPLQDPDSGGGDPDSRAVDPDADILVDPDSGLWS